MSRTLTRLRQVTGDPLLIRAGRNMVLTPHAESLQARAKNVVSEMRAVLDASPAPLSLSTLEKRFTLRTNEGFIDAFGPALVNAAAREAPGVTLEFVAKPEKDARFLREGRVDLEIGVLKNMGPEIRLQALFRDRFIVALAKNHPLAAFADMSREQFVSVGHVITSRRGLIRGPVDDALAACGMRRRIAAVVPGFSAALAVARDSQLIAVVPASCLQSAAGKEMVAFPLPVSTPEITVSQMWHPRHEHELAHRWLRQLVRRVCRQP
ncbi:LysR family transcriptional regulator [Klebsiella michiganensis]|uniref:LysR family transcriptional regulator n=1 Tax=Klebsiella michiganensis TaxID=1134687 RepID=UPI001E3C43E5|nr:LysR family transcriptional regulator [Klebsiella michiganensis]